GSGLSPVRDGSGANAVVARQDAVFPLRFGNDSFGPHLCAAKATEQPCIVLSLAGIGLDVDAPDDLRQLALAPGDKRSQVLARGVLAAAGLYEPHTESDPVTAQSR